MLKSFPWLFSGLGEFKGPPHNSLERQRHVPLATTAQVTSKLTRMEQLGIIRKVDDLSDWCAGMVIVPKANGSIRICCDYTRLNGSVKRERHILPSVEHLLAIIQCAKVFMKLDANSGFHQIPLDEAAQLLTTFISPMG